VEVQQALEHMKGFLTSPLVLVLLTLEKPLLLYIVAITKVVSANLAVECEEPRHVLKV
jgi:hypothetical protein